MDAIADRVETSEGSTSPPPRDAQGADELEGNRRRSRWIGRGFGIGLIVGLAVTAAHVAIVGYHILPFQLVFNLMMFPYLWAIIGFNRYRAHYVGTWAWKRPQIRTGTLMLIVAYFAILFGAGVLSARLGTTARRYYQKYLNARTLAEVYREQGRKAEAEVEKRRRNLADFREGKIPDGLDPGQKDFLRSLDRDPKATPEYRTYRRGLIRDGEQLQLMPQESNAVIFPRLAGYQEMLAEKYDHARWHPWLPVEPDPPPP